MKKTALLWILLAFCGAFPLLAADEADPGASTALTLEEAQKEALDRSPAYQKAQAAEREAGWGQLEAFSEGFLPHVTASGKYFFANQYAYEYVNFTGPTLTPFEEIFPDGSAALDAQFDLFDGFQNVHRLDAANNRHEAARIQSDFALLQMQEQVRLKFYEAVGANLLSQMADENVKTLEDHLRIVQDQLDNGQATRYDVLRVDVQLSEAKSDAVSYHDNLALAREDLTQTMGLPKDDRTLGGVLPDLDSDALLNEVAQTDFKDSPQLKAAQLQASAAADQSAASNASFWIPKVSLIGEYQWYDTQDYYLGTSLSTTKVLDTGNYNSSYFFGATATWNIFDGGESLAKARESDERAKQARADYEAASLQTPYDFDQWKRRLVSSLALYKAKLTDVDEAMESARLATVGFKAGTRTTTDVLDAELEEYRAKAGVVLAKLGALEALINLELVTGKRLGHE